MILLRSRKKGLRTQDTMVSPTRRMGVATPVALLLAALALMVMMACTSESSTLGNYRKGRTLHLSVVSLERTPELRYSTCDVLAGSNPPTCDPDGAKRRWSISPTAPGMELVLVRAKVENHTAVNAFINVDRSAAELRDFASASYFPISIPETAWQDFRGEPEALVRINLGECFDGTRALIDVGSSVMWQSEAEDAQLLAFEDSGVAVGPEGRAEIAPGSSLKHTFNQAGTYAYACSGSEGGERQAALQVAVPDTGRNYIDRTTRFLRGSFELPRGHGVDGFLIFEAPVDTEFRDMRWRAGDSITFGF